MRATSFLAALSVVATAFAQGPPEGIAPDAKAPEGCESTSKNNFTIGYTLLSSMKRETAVEAKNSALECILKDGVLKDPQGRVGSVVANYQFQFDGPPQAGAIYTGGFSVCKNSSLAIGSTTRWWKCGSGEFYNLYDRSIGGQCDEIRIVVTYKGQSSSSSSSSSSPSSTESSSSSSRSGSASSSATPSTTPNVSVNGTASATSSAGSSVSRITSVTGAAATSAGGSGNPPAPSAAAPGAVRVPRGEMFGAVVGIFGAALFL
ncbi:hypothetical protein CC80DRAFT_556114 [Byssothecium circinans]|uniref:Cell wall mannoprotein PIR1-like C-terminal domain-containing protein n=1 Tax=Byssothecium circinans TaxID=147558 RepID=A0A6A5TID5_9PLEO|nr:hypothetical protein CC80DRAFT_556114 [Byssothecium circinans]